MKELWCFTENRISVRFEYEWHDADGQWWRSHGNEQWQVCLSMLLTDISRATDAKRVGLSHVTQA